MVETDNKPKKIEDKPQGYPAAEHKMDPEPQYDDKEYYKGADKLKNKVAIITGGDSGIGRSVCILFAREGADIVFCYHSNHEDAQKTKSLVEAEGRRCISIAGDLKDSKFCKSIVDRTLKEFGKIDCLVNNAAVQFMQDDITGITDEQLQTTFQTNIFSYFYMARECIPHMKEGSTIINTSSVTAYKGKDTLMDYASTKGAIMAFTRSLATNLGSKNIRVNAVCPGPIWTPLIPASFPEDQIKKFGTNTTLGRPGQPVECATCYVFLASKDSSYMTGQALHPNGGTIINT